VVARERGALTVLPFALNYSAAHQILTGKFDLAEQLVNEADHITTATGNVPIAPAPACTYTFADFSGLLAAWRGDRDKTYQLRAAVIADATSARRKSRGRNRGVGSGNASHRQGRIRRRGDRGAACVRPGWAGIQHMGAS